VTYPIETRARAALHVTADLYAKAMLGPSENATHETRRVAFLQVRPAVVLTAERAVYEVPADGKDARPEKIDALLRIAMVTDEQFTEACEAVDRWERGVMAEAAAFMETLRGPWIQREWTTVKASDLRASVRGFGRMRFVSCTGEMDLGLAEHAEAGATQPSPFGYWCPDDWDEPLGEVG
jgi:hypothetical protein